MKGIILFTATTTVLLLSSENCYSHSTYIVAEETVPNVIMVDEEPPVDLIEHVEVSPGDAFVWVRGHWKWEDKWVWEKGHWARKPHPEASWVPGFWEKKHHHWYWKDGHWK